MRFGSGSSGALSGVSRRSVLGGGLALTLAGCNSSMLAPSGEAGGAAAPPGPLGPTTGEALGTGSVRVGLILPLTQNGAPSPLGVSMRNAAQLAIDEFAGPAITLMIVDDRSSPDGAAQAAQAEVAAYAELILGPVFANDVRSAAAVAKGAGRPIVAFSTDVSVASPGVYLLSFLVESYVDRIVDFAASRGKKSFAVLAPQNDYANVAVSEFQAATGRINAQVVATVRYVSGQPQEAAGQIAASGGQIDALFIPDQADGMPAVANALAAANIKTQILGTGVWNDARVLQLPQLQGAWFAAPDSAGFNALAERYRAKFNTEPTRLASLAYDAVTLAGMLARSPNPFSAKTLTNPSGFNGADGVFRFLANGRNERALAVMEIDNNAAVIVSPAPRSFAKG